MKTKNLVLYVSVPFVDFYLLYLLSAAVGILSTVLIIFATGVGGAYLARRQGFITWLKIQYVLQQGELPKRDLTDGLLLLVAAIVLITPGIITDFLAFLILVPGTRKIARGRLRKKMHRMLSTGKTGLAGFITQ